MNRLLIILLFLCGIALVVDACFLLHRVLGILVCGFLAIGYALFLSKSEDVPRQ